MMAVVRNIDREADLPSSGNEDIRANGNEIGAGVQQVANEPPLIDPPRAMCDLDPEFGRIIDGKNAQAVELG